LQTIAGALPEPGDIVWCHFPNANPKDPTMKNRPALVISVMDNGYSGHVNPPFRSMGTQSRMFD